MLMTSLVGFLTFGFIAVSRDGFQVVFERERTAGSHSIKIEAGTLHSLAAGTTLQEQVDLAAKVRAAFLAETAGSAEFMALLSFPKLLEEREVRMKIFRSLGSPDLKIFQAAVELSLNAVQLEKDPMVNRRFAAAFLSKEPQKKKAILDLAVAKPAYLKDLRIISLITEALVDPDPPLSGTALNLVNTEQSLQQLPAVAEALARRPEQSASAKVKLPDYRFFKEKVQPIFEAPGKDGIACVNCHPTHSILKLNPSGPGGATEEQLQEHYRSALRVVTLHSPEESLLLKKPTSSTDAAEGTLSSNLISHGGGVRWEKGSPQYQTILEWILTAAQK